MLALRDLQRVEDTIASTLATKKPFTVADESRPCLCVRNVFRQAARRNAGEGAAGLSNQHASGVCSNEFPATAATTSVDVVMDRGTSRIAHSCSCIKSALR